MQYTEDNILGLEVHNHLSSNLGGSAPGRIIDVDWYLGECIIESLNKKATLTKNLDAVLKFLNTGQWYVVYSPFKYY